MADVEAEGRRQNGGVEEELGEGAMGSRGKPEHPAVKAERLSQGEQSPQGKLAGGAGVATPEAGREERAPGSTARSTGAASSTAGRRAVPGSSPLRGGARSPHAPGLQTFGQKYMPFAAGFAQMSSEAPVYRSSRLHSINPTAAASEDTSYYYTLDSGKDTAASLAASPDTSREHVRNTRMMSQSGGGAGVKGWFSKPIE